VSNLKASLSKGDDHMQERLKQTSADIERQKQKEIEDL